MSTSDPAAGQGAQATARSPAALSVQTLARHLREGNVDLEFVASTGSTNSDLVARARQSAPLRIVLRAACEQTAGRGRLGRIWHGSANGSLLFSIAIPWNGDFASTAAVTLACGLGVAQCLRAHEVPVQLKWPNDILLDGRKLAGILTETAEDPRGNRTIVVGMGLNLFLEPAQQMAIGQSVAELAEKCGRASVRTQREQWLGRLAQAMIDAVREFDAHGFAGMRERFDACLAFFGQVVDLHAPGQATLHGTVRGVDEQGRLLLDCQGTVRALISGEISLRAHASRTGSPVAR